MESARLQPLPPCGVSSDIPTPFLTSSPDSVLHQKTTQNAISAISRLAELYAEDRAASSAEIARCRNLSQPLVAKILSTLVQGGLVKGSPGPGGGYRLARPPHEICLQDVVELFEREAQSPCPFGPGWCGQEEPCPLHESIVAMKQIETDFLCRTTFQVFSDNPKSRRRCSD